MKIAVYAIARDEEKFVDRFMESTKGADYVIVGDTGSADDTVGKLAGWGALVYPVTISPWRFDLARNAVLALVPPDVDVCVSLDLDEILMEGWREEIERLFVGDVTRMRYLFNYGEDLIFYHEKIHSRHGYRWHHACHERPEPYGPTPEVWAQSDLLLSTHHPDPTKERGFYLPLLEMSVREDPACPRNAFYYGRELYFNDRHAEALTELARYLALPGATWKYERSYAYRIAAKCYAALGDIEQARTNLMLAATEAPDTREPWCDLALLCHGCQDWAGTYAFASRALSITTRLLIYTHDAAAWGHMAHDLLSVAAYQLGLNELALQQAAIAVSHSPNDPRLLSNLEILEKMRG